MKNIIEKLKNNNKNTLEFCIGNDKKRYKYSEVYFDVVKVYMMLKEKGLQRNDRVGVLCGNLYEFILMDFACLLGGYIFVSFHYGDFKNKADIIIDEYKLKILFIEDKILDKSSENDIKRPISEVTKVLKRDTVNLEENIVPFEFEDHYTIIFTSGSTGTPKGMNVKLKSPKHFIDTCISKFNLGTEDKALIFLPFSQFSSRCYIYSAVLIGLDLALTTPEKLLFDLKYYKPTVLQGVPYFFEGIYESFSSHLMCSKSKRVTFKLYLKIKQLLPQGILKNLQRKMFKDAYEFWGGRMKHMITGAAPIRKEVLKFFNDIGIGLYEAYGLVETGLITLNYPGCSKIGSVGKVLPGKEIIFDNNQQIIVKSNYAWADSYVNSSEEESAKLFIGENEIATGDIGYLDEDNFLYLSGRIKDVIVLSNGLKVHPVGIENKLNSSALIKQSVVFGDNRPYVVSVVVASKENVEFEALEKEIKRINETLDESSKVKGFIIAKEPFSTKNNFITPNMKLDRRRIYEHYREELSNFYPQ